MKRLEKLDDAIKEAYKVRYENALKPIALALQIQLNDYLQGEPRIDRVSVRAKGIDSFVAKASKQSGKHFKYVEPLDEIQDQIGARIVTFYSSDISRVDGIVQRYYRHIEQRLRVPDSEWEFGYFGKHYILVIPSDVIPRDIVPEMIPRFFELQIKTLFQHAWSEAEHDLGYKPGVRPMTAEQKRLLAFTSAQAWGADRIFDQMFRERNN